MTGSKFAFSRTDDQKKPDIIVDLKRVDKKQIEKWTPEQRRMAADYLNQVERAFQTFKKEILSA